MSKELNVGLIGLGYIGKVHATAYRDIPICISQPKATSNLTAVLRSRLDTDQDVMRSAGSKLPQPIQMILCHTT